MTVVHGTDPRTGAPVPATVEDTSEAELDRRVAAAVEAGRQLAGRTLGARASLLRAIADALDADTAELVAIADSETALGVPRLTGELARTSAQLRLFAAAVEEGSFLEAIVDHPDPGATPPRPDLRRILQPLGPVAVFSASNFPFAFSVAGGDTASALAAGCPVVVKAHSAHPATSAATAAAVARGLDTAGAPAALHQVVYGRSAGNALVSHPDVRAVGFTGSTAGGRALFDRAAARPTPIPFYGELGSVNPVVVLPGAAANRPAELADGFAASLVLGVGQFCTNPGLVFAPESLAPALARAVGASTGGPMLTERMRTSYDEEVGARDRRSDVRAVATGSPGEGAFAVAPRLHQTTLARFRAALDVLVEECFGPAALVVTYPDDAPGELLGVLADLPGSLTGTVHADAEDLDTVGRVAAVLRGNAGRLVFNGWPTGVAVSWAQHHGGPYPATTAPLHTSVGVTAVRRWLAPVTYQDWPDALLPEALQESNPLAIPRRYDGVLGTR
ncbi:aldehyde dehydrogenase (NADP(+)) [Pseudonocardia alni]|uniref:aldehyde dehydrogenase (NADP(+)) n=1 Tax=Pseudonocardia alni TaxID=33907 RepID=UPI0033E9F85E